MEHLRLDHQKSPIVGEGLKQELYHYVYVRGRCSLVELFPIYARKEGFLELLEQLLVEKHLTTDLKSIWAREKQVVFSETPLSIAEESDDNVLNILNNQLHVIGKNFNYNTVIHINRDFQLQWHKMTMKPGESFHLGHFYDFRGRIYPKGHILTYQGTDFQKSLIRSEPYRIENIPNTTLTPEALRPHWWLMADVARSYGLDKATWDDRIAWAVSHPVWVMGAKEPFLYESALAASKAVETDHLVSLDATASGIQCLALMAQDEKSAEAVNLGTDFVNNPYRVVQEHMGEQYPYDKVKKALMTLNEGVTIQ